MAHHSGRSSRALTLAFAVLLAVAAAAACSRDPGSIVTTEPNVPPADYKGEILAYLRTYLNDPTGVRGASIGEPELRTIPATPRLSTEQVTPAHQRYMVCVRFDAKDSTGRYQGSREVLVAFLAGRLDTLVPARKEQCEKANWQPFPELERLRR
ncbi:hypothetical protein [Pseudorhodoplanes sp.]|uniref:hypothetical protein n=1 Tax=Pseudorhodoplanes sp. TaxID=1934341 RepID=UPI00391AE4C5